jgi:hypothetical protein
MYLESDVNVYGERVAVWVDYTDGYAGKVWGQKYDPDGQPAGNSFLVSMGSGEIDGEDGSRPEVGLLDNGQFLVVWTEHQGDIMRAMGRYFDANSQPIALPFALDPEPELKTGFPDVSTNGNQFAYTWLVYRENVTSVFVNVPGVTNTIDQTIADQQAALSLKGYPNPFTQETTLEYVLAESGHVTLVIFDLLGREVKRLIDQQQGPGTYSVQLQADELASGYYFTRLRQGALLESQILVRAE